MNTTTFSGSGFCWLRSCGRLLAQATAIVAVLAMAAPPAHAVCGDGGIDGIEACDLGAGNGDPTTCCTIACELRTSTDMCRAPAGVCDEPEFCDGTNAACDADGLQSTAVECRSVNGGCDVAEFCDGSLANCPMDVIQPSATACRDSAGICDIAENCSGTSKDCPANAVHPSTQVCRPSSGICDLDDSCDGVGVECTTDAVQPSSTLCGFATDALCDDDDQCDGIGKTCPDEVLTAGAICHFATEPCDGNRNCDGSSPACPFAAAGTDGDPCSNIDDFCRTGVCDETTGTAYVGFTAGNGLADSRHLIKNWNLQTTLSAIPEIAYNTFENPAALELLFDASVSNEGLSLTDSLAFQLGAAWHEHLLPVTDGFESYFTFQIVPGSTVGDGFAFVIQRDPVGLAAVGDPGQDLGYSGVFAIWNSVAIEFDTFNNAEGATPHISVHTRGPLPNDASEFFSIGSVGYPTLADGNEHTVEISYTPGTLAIYMDGSVAPTLQVSIDLDELELDHAICADPAAIPRNDCLDAQVSLLGAKAGAKPKLKFKWIKGEAVSLDDIGDMENFFGPTYAACVYEGGRTPLNFSLYAGPWWLPAGNGYKYSDSSGAGDKLKVSLTSGGALQSKASFKLSGPHFLDLTGAPLAAPVQAQIIRLDTNLCFGASYDTADILKNLNGSFKAKKK